jgi:hypothetical protein
MKTKLASAFGLAMVRGAKLVAISHWRSGVG